MNRYTKAAVGGTFDRFHRGHQELILNACRLADKVVVGVTSQEFVEDKKLADLILPYRTRVDDLLEFVWKKHLKKKVEIVMLDDVCGPTIEDDEIDLLVVSETTKSGAEVVNQNRISRAKDKLPVEVTKMVLDDEGKYLSSTRIREGLVARDGTFFGSVFDREIVLSEEQKHVLRDPVDKLVKNLDEVQAKVSQINSMVVVVGDSTTKIFREKQVFHHMCVVDNQIKRKQIDEWCYREDKNVVKIANKPGKIEAGVFRRLREAIDASTHVIEVDGEEDLLVLPLILGLPLGSLIYYGQPNKGVVEVRVCEESKHRWYEFLNPCK